MTKALISVSDKTGLLELATALVENNIEILSTGGTASYLRQHHIPLEEVSHYTEFPEIMGGRVKTLHPKIHGGILARLPEDAMIMQEKSIDAIDYVIVNRNFHPDETVDIIRAIIDAEHHRVKPRKVTL